MGKRIGNGLVADVDLHERIGEYDINGAVGPFAKGNAAADLQDTGHGNPDVVALEGNDLGRCVELDVNCRIHRVARNRQRLVEDDRTALIGRDERARGIREMRDKLNDAAGDRLRTIEREHYSGALLGIETYRAIQRQSMFHEREDAWQRIVDDASA